MEWSFHSNQPIYTQLIEQLTLAILSGEYPTGGKLPAQLEQTGLLYTRRTSGRFVTEDETVIQEARLNLARERAEEFLRAMAQLGYDRQAALQLLRGGEESDAHGGSDL